MSMYHLLEYSENYSMTSRSLWNYYRDEINDSAIESAYNNRINNNKVITSKSFEYKAKLTRSKPDDNILDAEVFVLYIWVIFGDLMIYHWLIAKKNLICRVQKNV